MSYNYQSGQDSSSLGINAQIADDIQQLTKCNKRLTRNLNRLGTRSDTHEVRRNLAKDRSDAKMLCKKIMGNLKSAKGVSNKQQLHKLTNQFEDALKQYTQISQETEKKERLVVTTLESHRGSDAGMDVDNETHMSQDDMMVQFQEWDQAEIQDRHQGIKEIEQDVREVHEMFKDLHLLVEEQQESLDVISDNISATKSKTEDANTELLLAEQYQKKARNKKCCILFIVIAILGVVVLLITTA